MIQMFRSRSVVVALVLGLLGVSAAVTAGQSRIELNDGSVLTGELVDVEAGGYRIRTPVLGEVVVPESQVLAIRPLGAVAEGGVPAPVSGGIGSIGQGAATLDEGGSAAALLGLQQQMIGDPTIMTAIGSLQGDPELQEALADPAFASAVLSGDLATLQQDPRFLRLIQHPTVRGIIERMVGQ